MGSSVDVPGVTHDFPEQITDPDDFRVEVQLLLSNFEMNMGLEQKHARELGEIQHRHQQRLEEKAERHLGVMMYYEDKYRRRVQQIEAEQQREVEAMEERHHEEREKVYDYTDDRDMVEPVREPDTYEEELTGW